MATTTRVKPSMGCGLVVVAALALGGVGLLKVAADAYRAAPDEVTAKTVAQTVFGLALVVGAGVYLHFARKVVREFEADERHRGKFAGQPWRWRQEWQGPAIASRDASGVGMAWLVAVLVNAMSLPAAYAVLTRPDLPRPVYLVLFFPVIGVAALVTAIRQTLQWRKFGRTRFVPSTLPGVIGGYLGGVIEVPARVALERDARLFLRCVRKTVSGSGKHTHTTESVVWEREERIAAEKWTSGFGHTEIPVLFHIPAGLPATDWETRESQVTWRLTAQAAVPGVDFETNFEVPVFATGETAPAPAAGAPALEAYSRKVVDAAEWTKAGVERQADGWVFRSTHLATSKWVSTVIGVGLVGLLVSYAGANVHWVPWATTLLFAAVTLLVAVDLWAGRCELRLVGDEVVVRVARWRGAKVTRVARADVAAVRAEKTMSIGYRHYHALVLVGRGVDTAPAAGAREPFRARKIRFQLARLGRELGVDDPAKMGERGAELLRQLTAAPRFEVVFAKHVAGTAVAEAVAELVLADVRGGK